MSDQSGAPAEAPSTPQEPPSVAPAAPAQTALEQQLVTLQQRWLELQQLYTEGHASPLHHAQTRTDRAACEEACADAMTRIGALLLDWSLQGGVVTLSAPEGGVVPTITPEDLSSVTAGETNGVVNGVANGVARPGAYTAANPPPRLAPRKVPGEFTPARVLTPQQQPAPRSARPASPSSLADTAELMRTVLAEMGTPSLPQNTEETRTELALLEALSAQHRLQVWEQLPAEVRVCLAGWTAARCRALQDLSVSLVFGLDLEERVRRIFRRLSDHMKVGQPGKAYGLARRHKPLHGSWFGDAQHYHEEFQSFIGLYTPLPEGEDAQLDPAAALQKIRRFLDSRPSPAELREYVGEFLSKGLAPDDEGLVALLLPREDDFFVREARFHSLRQALTSRRRALESAAQPAESKAAE